MKLRDKWIIASAVLLTVVYTLPSCKQCKKDKSDSTVSTDSTTTAINPNIKTIDAPHGDTTLIPILANILEQAFEASQKKDYEKLGLLMVYRGPDDKRHGDDVFRAKNKYEKGVVKITADVITKWTTGAESIDYTRVFELQQPDGRTLQVLEVIVAHPKHLDRKFFGFLLIGEEYKIADVTSYL
jgi:hypothetical protein